MNAKRQFLAMAKHDPSILTMRRCTGEDIRRLAPLAGLTITEARRAFTLHLFRRTTYLTLSLDPTFEPQEAVRIRAKKILDERMRSRAMRAAVSTPPPPIAPPIPAQPIPPRQPISVKVQTRKKASVNLSRYHFQEGE